MKVGIICYGHFDATISLGKYLTHLSPKVVVEYVFILSQSDLNVEIINLKGNKLKNGFVSSQKISNVVDEEILNYISPAKLKIFLFNTIKIADFKNYDLLLKLKNNIYRNKYDIVHFIGNNPWIVFLNCLIRNISTIHTLHEPYPFERISKYRLLRYKWTVKLMLRASAHIIVPSKVFYDRLQNNYKVSKNKISIVPFGPFEIYKKYSDKKISKEDNLLLYYGSIHEYKGVDVLMESMIKVLQVTRKLKLIIAGSYHCIKNDFLTSDPNIKIIRKYLSNKEIAELNELATVVVCPYKGASQSGVVMTSFAFGNPIIATNVGALPEMIENDVTGVIIEAGNSDILYRAILDLFQNPKKIHRLRLNVQNKYSDTGSNWLFISHQTYSLYKSLSGNLNS